MKLRSAFEEFLNEFSQVISYSSRIDFSIVKYILKGDFSEKGLLVTQVVIKNLAIVDTIVSDIRETVSHPVALKGEFERVFATPKFGKDVLEGCIVIPRFLRIGSNLVKSGEQACDSEV